MTEKIKNEEDISPKILRILDIYTRLLKGETIEQDKLVEEYSKNVRTIQRDIKTINSYIENDPISIDYNKVVRVRGEKKIKYRLEQTDNILSNSELLAVCKILLSSEAFRKDKMCDILHRLIKDCTKNEDDKALIKNLIEDEKKDYKEAYHEYEVIDKIWEIGKAIKDGKYIEVDYKRVTNNSNNDNENDEGKIRKRKLQPINIVFWKHHFYLIAFIDDENHRPSVNKSNNIRPLPYRIDRMKTLTILNDTINTNYNSSINVVDFKKKSPYMISSEPKRVWFSYSGDDVNGVCDCLSEARIVERKKIMSKENEKEYRIEYTITAVVGDGIDKWFRMHEPDVKVIKQEVIKQQVKQD